MSRAQRVLVVGGGIGGLTLGAALGQRGIDCEVIEARDRVSALGVGLMQPGNALRALRSIGVLQECLDAGFAFEQWLLHDARARAFHTLRSELGSEGVPACNGIRRTDLHAILLRAAQAAGTTITLRTTVTELRTSESVAEAVLSDGRRERYDYVIGFDGIRSTTRRQLFGEAHAHPSYTGAAVWRFTTERPSELDCAHMYFGVTTKVGLVPLSTTLMYLFLVAHAEGNPRLDPQTFPARLREHLREHQGLPAALRERISSPDDIVYSPIEEVLLPEPWYRDRVLLCGDAAHASTPHLAQGAAMAIEDAVVLAELLASELRPRDKLAAFMRRRLPRCRAVQDTSHALLRAELAAHGAQLAPLPASPPMQAPPHSFETIEALLREPF